MDMLRDALEAYGEDELTLSQWNARKTQAQLDGSWRWKSAVANVNATIQARVAKDAPDAAAIKARFVDLQDAMASELSRVLPSPGDGEATSGDQTEPCCSWRERIGGQWYHCINAIEGKQPTTGAKPFCAWHARECRHTAHPMDQSRVIDTPNAFGLCLHCYEATASSERATLQKTPPRVLSLKIPGVCRTQLQRAAKGQSLVDKKPAQRQDQPQLTRESVCCWQKEHYERSYIWRCSNRVLMHPTLRGAFLPFCGFHAPRCISEYGQKKKITNSKQPGQTQQSTDQASCPAVDRLNAFGMCRNHLEAHLSSLDYEQRAKCKLVDSEFDAPGVKECKRDDVVQRVLRHPLAPKGDPPTAQSSLHNEEDPMVPTSPASRSRTAALTAFMNRCVTSAQSLANAILNVALNHPNPVSRAAKDAIWQLQFLRRAQVVAIRIQRIFRGNRARRRVRALGFEHAAIRRTSACRVLQRLARGFLGRRRFVHEFERVEHAVPQIQRVMRGALVRKRMRERRAATRIQRNYRWYRQRLIAWALREEMAYMAALQREADANWDELQARLYAFRRWRARRVLRTQMLRWKVRKEAQYREQVFRVQSFFAAIMIQRRWRRYCKYRWIKKRYCGAQAIQARVRGWLTRHFWRDDPGICVCTSFVNPLNGFQYDHVKVNAQPSQSYSVPSRRIRMEYGALAIQRLFRGHIGRLDANTQWAAMLRRWEWISLSPLTDSSGKASGKSSDSMTLGHERYGFVLPSHDYHRLERLHMKPIVHDRHVDRGFAYKYQLVLDLIKDRDGKRAWSLAREQKWLREQQSVAPKAKRNLSPKRHQEFSQDNSKSGARGGISIVAGLYPLGSIVLVAVDSANGPYHRGRIVAIRQPRLKWNEPTFDILYERGLVSIRGVRTYQEKGVPASRLQRLTAQDVHTSRRRKRSVGQLIQNAIDRLKQDIQGRNNESDLQSEPETDAAFVEVLLNVDALADRLRETDAGRNLLADKHSFADFVFHNSILLRANWLQVVDHVRHGTRCRLIQDDAIPSIAAASTPLSFLYEEFGFRSEGTKEKRTHPMPERAEVIEMQLMELGFVRASNSRANIYQRLKKSDTATHAETSRDIKPSLDIRGMTKDDTAMDAMHQRIQTSQELHQLAYDLKTLPRERRREKIIEITNRHARAFVCGHSACGQCFSSYEAARQHQLNVHLHHERLALATPLVDQYMHSFWPPQSPWNQETNPPAFQHTVGYFKCRHCVNLEFRSRQELRSHLSKVHGQTKDQETEARIESSNPIAMPAKASRGQSVLWLGASVLCRMDFYAKVGVAKPSRLAPPCALHVNYLQVDCINCEIQDQRPTLPCRFFPSAALILQGQEEDQRVIFSVHDHALCAVVDDHQLHSDVISAVDIAKRKKKPKRVEKEEVRPRAVQIRGLCKDAKDRDWLLGFTFHALPTELRKTEDAFVTLDSKRLVWSRLSHVLGAVSVIPDDEKDGAERRFCIAVDSKLLVMSK